MRNNLGEIFYNSRIINLESTENEVLEKIFNELREKQVQKKENIEQILINMREEA